jgi:8-oxo-dGTP diphosphatase
METDIQILRYYDTLNYRYDDFLMTMHLYLCKLDGDQFVLNDHSEARWIDQHNLDTVRWLPADIELVSRWGSQGFDF